MNSIIVNLTQHNPSLEQIQAGVVEPRNPSRVRQLLTFHDVQDLHFFALQGRARDITDIAALAFPLRYKGEKRALIGGAPFFMPYLAHSLKARGITPVYAFSERVSEEQVQPDGSVRKVNVFKHVAFVDATLPDFNCRSSTGNLLIE